MIYTIGYGLKKIGEFILKLQENKIELLVDVRTRPFSRWNPKFSKAPFEAELERHNIKYLWRGANLGGLDENIDFETTIDEVVELSSSVGLCVMCSETEPEKCHRYQVLAPEFEKRGCTVEHIRWESKTKSKKKQIGFDF